MIKGKDIIRAIEECNLQEKEIVKIEYDSMNDVPFELIAFDVTASLSSIARDDEDSVEFADLFVRINEKANDILKERHVLEDLND